jgi:uncharacterized membrane protein
MRFSELRRKDGQERGRIVASTPAIGSAIIAALLLSLAFFGLGYVVPIAGFILPNIFMKVAMTLVGFGLGPLFKQTIRPTTRGIRTLLLMGLLETLGILSFTLGVSQATASLPVVLALSGTGGAIAVTYALIFLREKLEKNQLIGVVIASVGVFFLLYLT